MANDSERPQERAPEAGDPQKGIDDAILAARNDRETCAELLCRN